MRANRLLPHRWPTWVWWVGLTAFLLIRFPLYFLVSPSPAYLMDFEVYRTVALRLVQGHAVSLYAPTGSAWMLFKYAPCWALLWLPLAWMPGSTGVVVWSALTVLWVVLTGLIATALCQRAGLRAAAWLSVGAAFLLVRPLTAEFLNGQVDVLWGLLVVGFLWADGADHPWWAATALALAISLKLPALIVFLYAAARRHWSTVGRVLLIGGLVNAASGVLLLPSRPLELFRAWSGILWTSGAARAFEIGNQSLYALAARWLSADAYHLNVVTLPPVAVVGVSVLVSALLFGLIVARPSSRRGEPTRRVFDGSLLMVLMVLCSPTVWVATYSALLFPTTVALASFATRPARTWPQGGSAAFLLAMLVLSAMTHHAFWNAVGITRIQRESYVFLVLMVLPWFGLAVFGALWSWRRRHHQPG